MAFSRGCLLFLAVATAGALRAEENIAGNEVAAAAASKAFCEAEEIYHRTDYDADGVLEYAQTLHGGKRATVAAPDPATLPKPTSDEEAQISKLIKNLGSEEFSTREKAATDLAQIGPKAYALVQAAQSKEKDAEIVSRCRTLATQIAESLAPERAAGMRFGLLLQEDGTEIALVDRAFANAECPFGTDPKTVTPKAGYLFRVLTRQKAPVERNFIARGNLVLGYALIAFPREYGVTGKKCFCISNTGTIFERDFGSKEKMDEYIKECNAFAPTAPDWVPTE